MQVIHLLPPHLAFDLNVSLGGDERSDGLLVAVACGRIKWCRHALQRPGGFRRHFKKMLLRSFGLTCNTPHSFQHTPSINITDVKRLMSRYCRISGHYAWHTLDPSGSTPWFWPQCQHKHTHTQRTSHTQRTHTHTHTTHITQHTQTHTRSFRVICNDCYIHSICRRLTASEEKGRRVRGAAAWCELLHLPQKSLSHTVMMDGTNSATPIKNDHYTLRICVSPRTSFLVSMSALAVMRALTASVCPLHAAAFSGAHPFCRSDQFQRFAAPFSAPFSTMIRLGHTGAGGFQWTTVIKRDSILHIQPDTQNDKKI